MIPALPSSTLERKVNSPEFNSHLQSDVSPYRHAGHQQGGWDIIITSDIYRELPVCPELHKVLQRNNEI